VIPALVSLRHAIDQALDHLEPLAPVIAAWDAAQERAPKPAGL
jgi:hypothetical protein